MTGTGIAEHFGLGFSNAKELDFSAFQGTSLLQVMLASGTTPRQPDANLSATRSWRSSWGGSTTK